MKIYTFFTKCRERGHGVPSRKKIKNKQKKTTETLSGEISQFQGQMDTFISFKTEEGAPEWLCWLGT